MASDPDEIFGLPFLFTGGLPNSLDKFTEGNLRCFLIYLIEVSAKANRLNVWEKPAWWNTHLIPYSPVEVDTSRVPTEKVTEVLRDLVANCYRYYKATKILAVSEQLAELPRILLRIRDNGNNTKTLYDALSNTIYVTVRPENLTYDAKSLDKVSKKFQDNYTNEDVSFCKLKNTSEVTITKKGQQSVIIVDDDDDDNGGGSSGNGGRRIGNPDNRRSYTACARVTPFSVLATQKSASSSKEVSFAQIKSLPIIDLASDSDNDDEISKNKNSSSALCSDDSNHDATKNQIVASSPYVIELSDSDLSSKEEDDDQHDVNTSNEIASQQNYFYTFTSSSKQPPVIVLSDSESDESSPFPIKIISCESLSQESAYSRKSILHPLLKSPDKSRTSSVNSRPNTTVRASSPTNQQRGKRRHDQQISHIIDLVGSNDERSDSDDVVTCSGAIIDIDDDESDCGRRRTKRDSFVKSFDDDNSSVTSLRNYKRTRRKEVEIDDASKRETSVNGSGYRGRPSRSRKKKSDIYLNEPFPPSPPHQPKDDDCVSSVTHKNDFLKKFGLISKSECYESDNKKKAQKRVIPNLEKLVKSVTVWSKMPLDWLKLVAAGNKDVVFISKQRHRAKANSNYLKYVSTDKTFIAYSIEQANQYYDVIMAKKEERRQLRKAAQHSHLRVETSASSLSRWQNMGIEMSQRRRRLETRRIRAYLGESPSEDLIKSFLVTSTLAPCLVPLPHKVIQAAILGQSIPINMTL